MSPGPDVLNQGQTVKRLSHKADKAMFVLHLTYNLPLCFCLPFFFFLSCEEKLALLQTGAEQDRTETSLTWAKGSGGGKEEGVCSHPLSCLPRDRKLLQTKALCELSDTHSLMQTPHMLG